MKLTKELRKAGYDLITGPVRNHKNKQIWLKRGMDAVEYYRNVDQVFASPVKLPETIDPALNINATYTNEFNFKIGLSMLEKILEAIGLDSIGLNGAIKSGKTVTISYDNCRTKVLAAGDLEEYFSKADLVFTSKTLLNDLNRDNLLIISGVVEAKNLIIDIETDVNIDADVKAKLTELLDGKIELNSASSNKIKMTAKKDDYFPIAVKAHQIDYDKGVFDKAELITDSRRFF